MSAVGSLHFGESNHMFIAFVSFPIDLPVTLKTKKTSFVLVRLFNTVLIATLKKMKHIFHSPLIYEKMLVLFHSTLDDTVKIYNSNHHLLCHSLAIA